MKLRILPIPGFNPFRSALFAALWRSQLGSMIATGIDFGVTFVLTEVFQIWYLISTAIGALSGAVTHFTVAREWAFRQGEEVAGYLDPHSTQFLRYLLVSSASLLLNTAMVFGFTEWVGLPYGWSKLLCSLAVGLGFNFPLHARFVFRKGSAVTRVLLCVVSLSVGLGPLSADSAFAETQNLTSLKDVIPLALHVNATDSPVFAIEGAIAVFGASWELPGAPCSKRLAEGHTKWAAARELDPQKGWVGRREGELKSLQGCDSTPCFVKLTSHEGEQMGAIPAEKRLKVWSEAVEARTAKYLETGVRDPYERGVERFDPWSFFAQMGLPGIPPCEGGKFDCLRRGQQSGILKKTLEPQDEKPIRQVIDLRTWMSPDRKRSGWIARDVYSEHYFDSWGEWISWECVNTDTLKMRVWLAMEVDLLSKTNPLIRMARGRIIEGIRERASLHVQSLQTQSRSVFK